jgi:hypothetical protein
MLIRRTKDQLYLITQPDHGALTGFLAREWGGGPFALPGDRSAAILAAELHDLGWDRLDGEPLFCAAGQCPHDFLDHPTAPRLAAYTDGIERVTRLDPYAGLLVSMHFVGIYNGYYGYRGAAHRRAAERMLAGLPPDSQAHIRRFMDQELQRQADLRRRIRTGPHLRLHYLLLQVWDRLSLLACLTSPDDPGSALVRAITQGYPDVPTGAGRHAHPLTVAWQAPGVLALHPFPLRQAGVHYDLPVRILPNRPYQSAADLAAVWSATLPDTLRLTFIAG